MPVNYDYPLLNRIVKSFESNKETLGNIYVCACQHLLEPQKKMFELISNFGIDKDKIHILGKIYSTSKEILKELNDCGFDAQQPKFDLRDSFDQQHRVNCQKMFQSLVGTVAGGNRIIVIDDGAELISIFNENIDKIDKKTTVIGIEQTSSGFRKLEKIRLNFPVINVARSPIKLDKESPLIARLGCDRINEVIDKHSITEPRILVAGLGPVGKNTLLILKEEGYFVIAHDIVFNSKEEITDLVIGNRINIIIGVTGSNILNEKQIEKLNGAIKGRLYLVSMSSSDREFPALFLRNNVDTDGDIHSDTHWKNIVLINNGFPITFKGKRYESTPIEIEKTIALLLGSVLYATMNKIHSPGLVDVPKIISDLINHQ